MSINNTKPKGSSIEAFDATQQQNGKDSQAGELCPGCGKVGLDYDGCLNLVCPHCSYVSAGAFF